MSFGGGSNNQDNPTSPNPNSDFEVQPGVTDTISQLAWSPRANYLCATSWDKNVRIWEIGQGSASGKASLELGAPALCCAWSDDGSKVFAAGCDKKAMGWDLGSGQSVQVAQHDAPINFIYWYAPQSCVLTGSWDRTLRYWDIRQQKVALKLDLPERLFSADVRGKLGVFGTADRNIHIFDMSNPQRPFKSQISPLKFQTRVVRAWPDEKGFAVGSIEGRVAMHHVADVPREANFAFKCHRVKQHIYAVNDIAFTRYGTFSTVGSDGTLHYWCKESRSRLKQFKRGTLPFTACAFNGDSTIFAYAAGYDWHKGASGYEMDKMRPLLLLRSVADQEIRPKPPSK